MSMLTSSTKPSVFENPSFVHSCVHRSRYINADSFSASSFIATLRQIPSSALETCASRIIGTILAAALRWRNSGSA
ncbi:hypothetical protein VTG60DRAFT_1195 [Thermothelomyces hinnuleus]